MTFIDLFAGLGGFHKALHELGHKCVFASELNETLRVQYEKNWGIQPYGDIIRLVREDISVIPEHDILCAGFPCQPFSKAGKQQGREDERGNLFDEIVKILEFRKPRFFILENVPFIAKHDNEETWNYMKLQLEGLGYSVSHQNYSPHDFGIPQHRLRIFIVGSRVGLEHFSFDIIDDQKTGLKGDDIHRYIEKKSTNAKRLPQANIDCLELWQQFIDAIPDEVKIPGFPIWSMEFGANYPFEDISPASLSVSELSKYKGSFGKRLTGGSIEEQLQGLPSYARTTAEFPGWKKRFIKSNRQFYKENKKFLREIVAKISKYDSQSWQKLEWNVGTGDREIFKYLIQFRASGIRIKKVDYFPSLVCTSTQVPIIGWEKRYISRTEGLKLQSLENISLPDLDNAAFRALGNAVNAKIVKLIAKSLLDTVHLKGHTEKATYSKIKKVIPRSYATTKNS